MSFKNLLVTIIITFSIVSCQDKQPEEIQFDKGTMTGNVYKNKFFNFQITVPEEWDIQNDEQVKQIMQEGKDAIENEKLKAKVELNDIDNANLLTVFKHPADSVFDFNSSIVILAENVKRSGIETETEYLQHAKKLLQETGLQYTFLNKKYEYGLLNGSKYHSMDFKTNYGGYDVSQSYIVTIKNNFALVYILTYSNTEQRKELEDILKTVKPYKTKNI